MLSGSNVLPLLGMIGLPEILIIGGIVVLFFMAPRLPQVMRSFGQSFVEFKKGLRDDTPPTDEQKPPTK